MVSLVCCLLPPFFIKFKEKRKIPQLGSNFSSTPRLLATVDLAQILISSPPSHPFPAVPLRIFQIAPAFPIRGPFVSSLYFRTSLLLVLHFPYEGILCPPAWAHQDRPMRLPVTAAAAALVTIAAALIALFAATADGLGSAATIAISYGTGTVCGVRAGAALPRSIQCARKAQQAFSIPPNISFDSVSGGQDFLCGLRAGGTAFFCWNASNASTDLPLKRLYNGPGPLTNLTVGEDQIAALDRNGTTIRWWRGNGGFPEAVESGSYHSLTSGNGFTCALHENNSVQCWGEGGKVIQEDFLNKSMESIVAGDYHVCGLNSTGFLVCRGENDYGQLDAPSGPPFQFSSLALGARHSCAVCTNGTVVCWGGGGGGIGSYAPVNTTSFLSIVAGGDLTCGLTTENFSVVCWRTNRSEPAVTMLPPGILPGVCTADQSSCKCQIVPGSESLCSDSGVICNPCPYPSSPPPPPPPSVPPPPSTSRKTSKGWLAFGIVGSVGAFAGACTIVSCLWTGVFRNKKVHNSVQPTINTAGNGGTNAEDISGAGDGGSIIPSVFTSPSGSRSRIFRQGSRVMRRQRSGPSSFKDRAEEFTFAELAAATKDFSSETKIGAGSFGTVYKGKLPDGREVAIKRSESGPKTKKFQEKESAFQSELAFLSRLHHKHLVGLVGYCEEKEERLLVYEYMKNGALYDHLHSKDNTSTVLNSWKMRIRVLLDAARGIEYLHNYAVPPIIHRDIKSSNILLDGNWVARVSDFGLSLMGPESDGGHLSIKAAGTVGYMDPEYYGLHHLTVKSDVYGLGVVMLEVLTGKRAIFKDEEGNPMSVVDYAVPSIATGEVARVLDARVAPPGPHEAEAVELVAYTAVHCVSLEGRERPFMTDIVANLESALALCDDSHGSISSASISLTSVD